MKAGRLLFIFMAASLAVFYQCRHKPEDQLAIGNPCHPDTVYFKRDVLPVLVSSCAMVGCYASATAMDGVILDNYIDVMNTGDVRPGRPDNSDLYEVLVETRPDKRMPPPPLDPLNADQIAMIRKWILQGAENLTCDDE